MRGDETYPHLWPRNVHASVHDKNRDTLAHRLIGCEFLLISGKTLAPGKVNEMPGGGSRFNDITLFDTLIALLGQSRGWRVTFSMLRGFFINVDLGEA